MELFRFTPTASFEDILREGVAINKAKTITWIERFREPGEFTIEAPVSSGLMDILFIGSMISHTDTREVMIVENHEIDEDVEESEPMLTITGRSLDSWLEQRNVGEDVADDGGSSESLSDYALAFDTTWNQIADLINYHINAGPGGPFINTGDEVGMWYAVPDQEHIGTSSAATRIVKRGNLHKRVLELLAIDDFGIKVVRPGPDLAYSGTTEFRIHNGVDRSEYIIFSHVGGDLKKAKYFWSNKNLKNDAYVVSTYNELRVVGTETGYNRRILFVDASDLDSQWQEYPTGVDRDAILAAMIVRGQDALKGQKLVSITSTDVAASTKYQFRKDYDVGDLVTVKGNYDTQSVMRVTEYVEFQDENGESGYPTLSALD